MCLQVGSKKSIQTTTFKAVCVFAKTLACAAHLLCIPAANAGHKHATKFSFWHVQKIRANILSQGKKNGQLKC
jgi:hypothetical protein